MLILKNLLIWTSIQSSTMRYIDDVTRTYFVNGSVLFVYWSNAPVDFRQECSKFLACSEIVTLQSCCVDKIEAERNDERGYVKNTLLLLGDVIPDEEQIRMMKNCKNWNSGSRIVMLLQNKTEEIVRNLLKRFWTLTKAINVAIMSIRGTSVKFYTLEPYKNFIMEELSIENLFPNKIPKNFNGSILTASTTQLIPWAMKSNGQYDGIEVRMMNALSKHFNFRIEYKNPLPGENPFRVMYVNGRMTGTFGYLDRLEADVLFHGAQLRLDRYEVADVIATHTINQVIWVLPTYPFTFDWTSLFVMFQFELWLLLLFFLFLISFMIFILTKPGYVSFTLNDAFFQALALYLSASISYRGNSYLYRMFMTFSAFYTLIIIASYESCLIGFLTTPRSGKQYGSAEDALDDGLIVNVFPSTPLNLTHHRFWNKALVPGRHAFSADFNRLFFLVIHNKTIFFMCSQIDIQYILNQYYLREREHVQVQVLDDMAILFLPTFYTSKGHPLLPLLRLSILRLVETGLVDFWVHEIVGWIAEDDDNTRDPFPLSLAHLKGLFLVEAGLLIFSISVFLCELVYWNRNLLGNDLLLKIEVNA